MATEHFRQSGIVLNNAKVFWDLESVEEEEEENEDGKHH